MNEARRKANLEDLPDGERKADDPGSGKTPTGIWKHVCQALFAEEEFQPQKELDSSETYALFKLDTSTRGAGGPITPSDAECSAAVQEWQEGFDKFDDNSAVNGGLNYADVASEQASFVTLYNPNDDATGHCSVATCEIPAAIRDEPQKKASGIVCSTTPSAFKNQKLFNAAVEEWQQGFEAFKDDPPVDKGVKYSEANSKQVSFLTLYNPDSKAEGQCSVATCTVSEDTGGEGQEKTVSGLVCSTTPNVFGKESLFTQNQWDSIKGVLSNSASATVPSILALATLLIAALVS
ncbi:hypothetical protein Emag_007716 [Eimeria magna]